MQIVRTVGKKRGEVDSSQLPSLRMQGTPRE